MKLGDLFNKLWYCAGEKDGIRPLCTPDDPHAEGIVCGYRWQASFIPEDFKAIADLALVSPELISELSCQISKLEDKLADARRGESVSLLRSPIEAAADEILRNTDLNQGIKQILGGEG